MARKKRRASPPSPPQQPVQNGPFHTPFGDLKTLLRDASPPPAPPPDASKPSRKAPPAPATGRPSPAPHSAPMPPERQEQRDQALFLAEMAGVQRLAPDPRGRVQHRRTTSRPRQRLLDNLAILNDLQDLVDGRSEFSIQYTDEYMEGVAPDVDRRLAQRLHHGDFAVQGHLDLHGYTVDEAKGAVVRFLVAAYARGRRCVRLVHGRGRNSPDNRPVLKEQVRFWLSHGRLSRLILAFATAPVADGGAGAVYVLLRRSPQTTRK